MENYENITVGIVLMPGFFVHEVAMTYDVFSQAKRVVGQDLHVLLIAPTQEPVAAGCGARLKPHFSMAVAPKLDVLVVPGGCGSHPELLASNVAGGSLRLDGTSICRGAGNEEVADLHYGNDSTLMKWVSEAASRATIVMSHGVGAFTLGDAGFFDGGGTFRVATAPGTEGMLKAVFPAIRTLPVGRRIAVSGKAITSAGGFAVFESSLSVVLHIYGVVTAQNVQASLVFSKDNFEHAVSHDTSVAPSGSLSTAEDGDPSDSFTAFAPMVVGIMLLDGMRLSELVAPRAIFRHIPNVTAIFIGADLAETTTYEGAALFPDESVEAMRKFAMQLDSSVESSADSRLVDVLIVPGGTGSSDYFVDEPETVKAERDSVSYADMPGVIAFVHKVGASAKLVAGTSWGAFTLADAGLLAGKVATTMRGHGVQLARRNPQITKVDDRIAIVKDGKAITSHGGVAAYEAALYMLRVLYGEQKSTAVGRGIVCAEDNLNALKEARESDSGELRGGLRNSLASGARRRLSLHSPAAAALTAMLVLFVVVEAAERAS